jgi:hypothetical protein
MGKSEVLNRAKILLNIEEEVLYIVDVVSDSKIMESTYVRIYLTISNQMGTKDELTCQVPNFAKLMSKWKVYAHFCHIQVGPGIC